MVLKMYDVFVVGGGVNGCGIARDAAGRGLCVALAEMNDLASATSSASTKLFHGGLRYLEYFEVHLVRKALIEREILLRAMPHISWPMRFLLPYHSEMRFEASSPASRLLSMVMPWMKGRRPWWMIRLGLFLYDTLGGREILPSTRGIDLQSDDAGKPLQAKYEKAFEYSDCWVDDARLVVLNARDAERRGARIMTRTKVVEVERHESHWVITTENSQSGEREQHLAKAIVNAAGPWVEDIIQNKIRLDTSEGVRLVRGSHIVTRKLFDHDRAYFFQGSDGRIIFAIPYEEDFTLIGTTDQDHGPADETPECSDEERDYLLNFVASYFEEPVTKDDIVWSYSGVRPLYDDGAKSATAATREYVLTLDDSAAPALNVFGGKITTYRKLAQGAMSKLSPFFPGLAENWTAGVPLPGGDFPVNNVHRLTSGLMRDYPFLDPVWARRLFRAYGTETREVLGAATSATDLGRNFGANLTEQEVKWLMANEYAATAEDIVWRRSKLGLRLTESEIAALDSWMQERDTQNSAA